jgi:predicted RNA-binding protein with PUA-like domain
MGYWLVKTEPESYSWSQLVSDGTAHWDGVRNYEARNHLRSMSKGDRVLVYHSVSDRCVVGVAEVTRAAYPDPTAQKGDWSAVDLRPKGALLRPVTLQQIRLADALSGIALVARSRLSVMPLSAEHFEHIIALGGGVQRLPRR